MKQKYIKALHIMIAGVIVMATLAGCGQDAQKPSPQEEESSYYSDDSIAKSAVQPYSLFRSQMVLQREQEVPVWGTADSAKEGKELTVSFGGQTKKTTVKDGKWQVSLDSMEANSKGQEMRISCDGNEVRFKNILVGEVWLASGQSNMAFYIEYLQGATAQDIKKDCDYPEVRIFVTPETLNKEPQTTVTDAKGWKSCGTLTINTSQFPTVGFLFARQLYNELKVPVGIVTSAYGGTRVETWIPPETLKASEVPVYGNLIAPECAYNSMIHPHEPFAVRGMIWYQGEGNCFPDTHVKYYSDYMKLMIESRREGFKNPDMPVIQIQLPTYAGADADYSYLRLQQMEAEKKVGHLYTTINYDTGNPNDIHPSDKLKVGQRAANMALEKVYGKQADNNYPTLEAAKLQGSAVLLTFSQAEKGLQIINPEITGLQVCGSDGKYYQAKAEQASQANQVLVSASEVANPVGIRYACQGNMQPTQFFGANMLPVKPFELSKIEG